MPKPLMGAFGTIKPAMRKSESAILRLDLLGNMSIQLLDGTSLTPTGAKTKGLLAILALSDRRPIPRKVLSHLLWSRRSDEQARASLRQEIHRLSEVLSPVGADVLDIQRHALALKPVLTTVDVERYLNATPSGILKLPETEGILLSDLSGVDIALDEWLVAQRSRLRQHLISTLEQAQLSLPDAEQRMTATSRLLRLDRLNENGWKQLLTELCRASDLGAALQAAEQCVATFLDVLNTEPGAALMTIITELRTAYEQGRSSLQDLPGGADMRAGKGGALPGGSGVGEGWARQEHFVARVAFAPPGYNGHAERQGGVVEAVLDATAEGLSRYGFFAVLAADDGAVSVAEPAALDGSVADYRVTTRIQAGYHPDGSENGGEPSVRLVVRVIDERRGGVIVWAERFELGRSGADDIASLVISETAWRIVMAEARYAAHRVIDDTSPIEVGLRVFSLLTRRDQESFLVMDAFLEKALQHWPDHGFLLLNKALCGLLRSMEEYAPARAGSGREAAIESARRLVSVVPETLIGRIILARLLLDAPDGVRAGTIVLDEIRHCAPAHGLLSLLESYAATVGGRISEISTGFEDFRYSHPTHPFMDVFDLDAVLLALLGRHTADAVARSRISLAMQPTRVAMQTLHLAGLAALQLRHEEDTRQEQADTLAQLLMLEPRFHLGWVEDHYRHLPSVLREELRMLLSHAGLPEAPARASS